MKVEAHHGLLAELAKAEAAEVGVAVDASVSVRVRTEVTEVAAVAEAELGKDALNVGAEGTNVERVNTSGGRRGGSDGG